MSEDQIVIMIQAFRKYIIELLPDMDKHSTWHLMNAFEDKYNAFRSGYEEAINALRNT